ncbi:DUF6691 family protein [Roseibium algae]|uniref:DUF6691 family protein n=1 Tax=Roseibium algae TaxID=3123038 RepID=A0ABU8TRG8_9HYPH
MLKTLSAFIIGLIFGTGIILSGMANPAKVLNFFDVYGTWDPSLMFVMGGALVVTTIGYRLVFQMNHPLLESGFSLPARKDIDGKLILGAATFGIGWGLSGFCPGGLIPALGLGSIEPLYAAAGIITGILAFRLVTQSRLNQPAT